MAAQGRRADALLEVARAHLSESEGRGILGALACDGSCKPGAWAGLLGDWLAWLLGRLLL